MSEVDKKNISVRISLISKGEGIVVVLNKKKIEKIREVLKEELQKVPEFDVERAYDESYRYKRIKLSTGILEKVIFGEKKDLFGYNRLCLIFPVSELRKLDLSEIDFAGIYISFANLSYTNANIDPQKVCDKSLWGTNLTGLDLKGKDFTDVYIEEADLSNTGADIDPQTVRGKSLWRTNLTGLDLKGKDFTDVYIEEADLSNTGADIDPQTVFGKNLLGTNLTGLDLRGKDFTDVIICGANLSNTGIRTEEEVVDEFISTVKELVKSKNTKAK